MTTTSHGTAMSSSALRSRIMPRGTPMPPMDDDANDLPIAGTPTKAQPRPAADPSPAPRSLVRAKPSKDVSPEIVEQLNERVAVVDDAEALSITTPQEYEVSVDLLKKVKVSAKAIKDLRLSLLKPIEEKESAIRDFFRPFEEALAKAEERIKASGLKFLRDAESRRRAEQLKAEEDARRRAESERAKLERNADRADKRGDTASAEALRDAAATVSAAPVIVPTIAPAVAGISKRTLWKARVADMDAFLRWVIDTKSYGLLKVDQSAIDGLARGSKGTVQYPGLEIYSEDTMGVRVG